MAKDKGGETGWRGSRELWLRAAYEALIDGGVDAVRILPLGKRVALSRTSFYWFFADREALLDALLDLWREKNTGNLIGRTVASADSLPEAVLNIFDCWLDGTRFDAHFEFAVRSWALQASKVEDEITKADAARLSALRDMFMRFGIEAGPADVRARTLYLTQIGYISMKSVEDLALRLARIPYYVEVFAGAPPTARELARFHARHQHAPARARGAVATGRIVHDQTSE